MIRPKPNPSRNIVGRREGGGCSIMDMGANWVERKTTIQLQNSELFDCVQTSPLGRGSLDLILPTPACDAF